MNLDWTPPTFETERLVLRPVGPADAPAVFLYASNPAVTRFTLFETHQTIDDSRWFTTDYVRSRYANREPDPDSESEPGPPPGPRPGDPSTHRIE